LTNADVEPDDMPNRLEIVGRVINHLTRDERQNGGGRASRGRGVSSCAAATAEKPAAASANTAKPVIDRRMALPQFG
jgi:hypothetical protein